MASRPVSQVWPDRFGWKASRVSRRFSACVLAGVVALAALSGAAVAHPLAPSLLELRELGDGRVDVRFKTPVMQARGAAHAPSLPASCTPVGGATETREGTGVVVEYRVDCGAGKRLHIIHEAVAGSGRLIFVCIGDGVRDIRMQPRDDRQVGDLLVMPKPEPTRKSRHQRHRSTHILVAAGFGQ